jgi:hypothetical protein
MADGLDVVAVGILHETAVVVGMILGPEAGLAIVGAARRESGGIECRIAGRSFAANAICTGPLVN